MTCRELISFLDDYVADEISSAARETFEQHLSACRHCRDYLREYRQTIELVRDSMPLDAPVPADVPAEIVEAMHHALRTGRS